MDPLMWWNVLPVWMFILMCAIILVFLFIHFNGSKSAKVGAGIGGCIGCIGFALGPLGAATGVLVGAVLGGSIGEGLHNERDPMDTIFQCLKFGRDNYFLKQR